MGQLPSYLLSAGTDRAAGGRDGCGHAADTRSRHTTDDGRHRRERDVRQAQSAYEKELTLAGDA